MKLFNDLNSDQKKVINAHGFCFLQSLSNTIKLQQTNMKLQQNVNDS